MDQAGIQEAPAPVLNGKRAHSKAVRAEIYSAWSAERCRDLILRSAAILAHDGLSMDGVRRGQPPPNISVHEGIEREQHAGRG